MDVLHLPCMCLSPKNHPFPSHFHIKSSFSFPFSLPISTFLPNPCCCQHARLVFPSNDVFLKSQSIFTTRISPAILPPPRHYHFSAITSPPHPHNLNFQFVFPIHLNPSITTNPSPILCNSTHHKIHGSNMHLPPHLFDQSKLRNCHHLNPSTVINPSQFILGSNMHLPLNPSIPRWSLGLFS